MVERTFAEILPDGKLGNTIVATPEHIATLQGEWIEYFADNPAVRSGEYNRSLNKFVRSKPFPKWVLDINGEWKAPKSIPEQDPQLYEWDDPNNNWKVRGKRLIDN